MHSTIPLMRSYEMNTRHTVKIQCVSPLASECMYVQCGKKTFYAEMAQTRYEDRWDGLNVNIPPAVFEVDACGCCLFAIQEAESTVLRKNKTQTETERDSSHVKMELGATDPWGLEDTKKRRKM